MKDHEPRLARTLDLELTEVVSDEGVAHDVVAGSVGEDDLEVPIRPRAILAGDVPGNRRRHDANVFSALFNKLTHEVRAEKTRAASDQRA